MKNTHTELNVLLSVVICLIAGCAPSADQLAKNRSQGFPVRVGIQDANGLPVELQIYKPLPVDARLQIDERMPVELVVLDNKPLPVEANIPAVTVRFVPDRSVWIMLAIVCLMLFFMMTAAFASCRAAVNAKRAAEKQAK